MIYEPSEDSHLIKKYIKGYSKNKKVLDVGTGSGILAKEALKYTKNVIASDINKECFSGLRQMWGRDLVRDDTLAKNLEITVHTPFLDEELIKYAMQLPSKWKIVKDKKKVILREVAEEFLGEFAWRKKKAAQYGSCFDKAISKLAKKDGFKLKKDWLDCL